MDELEIELEWEEARERIHDKALGIAIKVTLVGMTIFGAILFFLMFYVWR